MTLLILGICLVDKIEIRYGLVLTYRCNAACPGCNRLLDVQPWVDSDITLEELQTGYKRVVASNIKIHKCRVSGGEPILHPQFQECMDIIQKTWNKDYRAKTCVFSNGIKTPPHSNGWRYRVAEIKDKYSHFQPPMISPYDLGMEPKHGMKNECRRQNGCGRVFDAFGFSFCIFAGVIGRMMGIDVYSPTPIIEGREDICKHCVFSQGIKKAFVLFKGVNSGKIEYPTESYKNALIENKKNGIMEPTRFLDR